MEEKPFHELEHIGQNKNDNVVKSVRQQTAI